MLRLLPFAAISALLVGCDAAPNLVGTWNGEMPENETIKTSKGEFQTNIVLTIRPDHTFHASTMTAVLDGTWDAAPNQLTLHPQKAMINGRDISEVKAKLEPIMRMLPPAQRGALEAYDPSKPWVLEIRNGGKNLFLPSRGEGVSSFTFRKAS